MSIDFSDYVNCLDEDDHTHTEALESSYHEASRVMSARGLQNYLEGMRAMCTLGRGQDLVLTYVQEMPGVAKEVGEDIVPHIVEAMMKLASHTSGTVITLILGNMPLVSQRLGDAEVVRGYLQLLHQLAGKAPRGLRPMMENLEELLSKLTLGGLRRWALWGAQAHARDLEGQMAYFALQSDASRSVLQKERRGTLFIDNQRRLNFYLRALWGRAFLMRPTSGDYENRLGLKPYIEGFQIYVPDAFDASVGNNGIEIYRAAVAHCAAHMVYTVEQLDAEKLSEAQMCCINLFEDARIEYLAYREFPGLSKLWLSFYTAALESEKDAEGLHQAVELMLRLTRTIMDRDYRDENADINRIADDFFTQLESDPFKPMLSRQAGINFYSQLTEIAQIPSVRVLNNWPIPYRDDNRFSWEFEANMFITEGESYIPEVQRQLRKYVSAIDMATEVDCELAGDDAEEIWVCADELFPYEDTGISFNQMWGREPVSEPYHYDEWDYHVQLSRPDWSTVIERRHGKGDPQIMDAILEKYKPVANRIRHLIDLLQPQGIVRHRGYEDGEEIDINAAVRAMTDIRRGSMPDPRINIRIRRHLRDLSLIVLMDLSESTNDKIGGIKEGEEGYEEQPSILDLTREATGLLAWAVDSIGDNFAVHGFASDGRHDVQYYRFKDFNEAYADEAKARLAGMKGGLSTRMGTALRHAGWHMAQQVSQKRLIILITDGEPADIDERDPQYLRHDAKRAVEELAAKGVYTYCLTLDPDADNYVARIFGASNYSIVDNLERLPERLPAVFSALTA
jgi:nitric oxide reductase NorD protein